MNKVSVFKRNHMVVALEPIGSPEEANDSSLPFFSSSCLFSSALSKNTSIAKHFESILKNETLKIERI